MLDLESVRLFVLAAEYGNLTRAAEAAGTVQPVVSQRIKALEMALGRRLLDRTPRFVRLTQAGAAFLPRAKDLLAAHDAAVAEEAEVPPPIRIAISDHTLGTHFDSVLRRMRQGPPAGTGFAVQLGQSAEMQALFEAGTVDLAVIRRQAGSEEGEVLGEDPLDWRAPENWQPSAGAALPLVLLPPPCAVRAVAIKALERDGRSWQESFVGGSCLALVAAVQPGLGIAPLGRLVGGSLPLGRAELPELPISRIVLLARTPDAHLAAAARALAASVREVLR